MQVKVVLQHDKYAQPQATFVFASGARTESPLANLQPRQLEELLQLHRDSSGPNQFLKHGGPKVWTERRSIQVRLAVTVPATLVVIVAEGVLTTRMCDTTVPPDAFFVFRCGSRRIACLRRGVGGMPPLRLAVVCECELRGCGDRPCHRNCWHCAGSGGRGRPSDCPSTQRRDSACQYRPSGETAGGGLRENSQKAGINWHSNMRIKGR